jgi:hypothetical protein
MAGRRIHFQFLFGSQKVFHTKLKSDTPDTIFVAKGDSMHFRDPEFQGTIAVSSRLTIYSVRQGDGDETARISFSRPPESKREKPPRNLVVNFLNANPEAGLPESVINRSVGKSEDGVWSLDFGARQVKSSVKNAILVDGDDREVLAVRKVSETALEIDALREVVPLVAFALGIASFLCKLT